MRCQLGDPVGFEEARPAESRPPGTFSDEVIAYEAGDALTWNVLVPQDRVRVIVTNGWVTLDGVLDWQYQKEAAARAVRTASPRPYSAAIASTERRPICCASWSASTSAVVTAPARPVHAA